MRKSKGRAAVIEKQKQKKIFRKIEEKTAMYSQPALQKKTQPYMLHTMCFESDANNDISDRQKSMYIFFSHSQSQ